MEQQRQIAGIKDGSFELPGTGRPLIFNQVTMESHRNANTLIRGSTIVGTETIGKEDRGKLMP